MNPHPTDDENADGADASGGAAPDGPGEAGGAQGIFPMRVAVQLTGLTQDTIRAWERRYRAIEPVRSAGNTRKFTHDDIRRLLLLREATEAGHSIGNIAELDEASLRALKRVGRGASGAVAGTSRVAEGPAAWESAGAWGEGAGDLSPVSGYCELLTRFDIVQAGAWLRRLAALHPPRAFVREVVVPILAEMRERRADARLGGPHMVAAWQQLTATLQVLLEVTASARVAPELLAVGAPRQRHAIGAMAVALLARHFGHESVFLGVSVPEADVLWAVDALRVSTVVFDLSVPITPDRSRACGYRARAAGDAQPRVAPRASLERAADAA
ncbi:MAG: MerR family transcriptional regulator [Myxococcota bacterium]